MRDWIRLVEDAENHGIKLHFDDGMVEMVLNGKKIGWFTVDVTHKAEGCVSIHSSIDNEYRNKGYGKIAYDWVENWAKSKGLRLIPSDRLSPGAYALWKSRDPSAVADFEVIDYFIDRNGKRHGGLEKLWYSPYAIEKYNLREGALAEKIERLPIKGESNDEVTLYSNCRKAEIKRALASASYGTLRGGWSNGLVLWDANDATHQEVGKSLGGIGHVFILGRSIDDLLQEADWDCDGTLYEAGIGGFLMGVENFAESIAHHFGGLTKIGKLIWDGNENTIIKETAIPGWYGGVFTGSDGKPHKIETNGGWILPNGSYEEIDHYRDWHHVSIALASFADEVRNDDGGIDEHSEDAAWGMALDDGWVRLHIDKQTFNTQFVPGEVSREAIRTLLELIDEDVYHATYALELGIGGYASFHDKKQFVRAIREALKK